MDQLKSEVVEFLKKDQIGVKQQSFNTTQYIAKILTDNQKRQNLLAIYDDFVEQERQCENLINDIVEEKFDQFTDLLKKPQIYGEAYERLAQIARQARRKIGKSKDLLLKKQQDLNQLHLNALYHKEIQQTLNKVIQQRLQLQVIENQIQNKQIYNACVDIKKLERSLQNYDKDRQKTPVIQQIYISVENKYSSIQNEILKELNLFYFGVSKKLIVEIDVETQENTITFDRDLSGSILSQNFTKFQNQTNSFKNAKEYKQFLMDQLNINLKSYKEFEAKNELIQLMLQEQVMATSQDPYQDLKCFTHETLKKYIDLCFTFDDFKSVQELVKMKTNKFGEISIIQQADQTLLSFTLLIKGASVIRKSGALLSEFFNGFKANVENYFNIQVLLFLKQILKKKSKLNIINNDPHHILKILNFFNLDIYSAVSEFFKLLLCSACIIIRKQILLGFVLEMFEIEFEENAKLLSLSDIFNILVGSINQIFSYFYKTSESNRKENIKFTQELLIQTLFPKVLDTSCLYFLLQRENLNQTIQYYRASMIKYLNSPDCTLKEPFDQKTKSFQDCGSEFAQKNLEEFEQAFKQSCRTMMAQNYQNEKQFTPQEFINKPISWVEFFKAPGGLDTRLKRIIEKQLKLVFQETLPLSKYIPEIFSFMHNLLIVSIFNRIIDLDKMQFSLLNWVLNVVLQEARYKFKNYVRSSYSEEQIYNNEKVNLVKKHISYLQWKVKFVDTNQLLTDLTNPQSRLQQFQGNKQFKNEYKQFFIKAYQDQLKMKSRVNDEQLIKSKEALEGFTSLHEHLNLFLKFSSVIFEQVFLRISEEELIKSLKIQGVEIKFDTKNQLSRKIQIIRRYKEYQDMQSFKLKVDPNNKNLNVLEQRFRDEYHEAVFRTLELMEQLIEVQRNIFFVLRYEMFGRALCYLLNDHDGTVQTQDLDVFCSNNLQDFYFDTYSFIQILEENLKKDNIQLILGDFWMVFKICFRTNFLNKKNFKKSYITSVLKDLNILRNEFKSIPIVKKRYLMFQSLLKTIKKFKKQQAVQKDLQNYSQLKFKEQNLFLNLIHLNISQVKFSYFFRLNAQIRKKYFNKNTLIKQKNIVYEYITYLIQKKIKTILISVLMDPFVQFHPYSGPESTGTTIMAVCYDGGVIIGADSRTTSGQFIADRVADKLDFVHDRIFCLRSGSAADTQTINRYVRHYMDGHATELGRLPAVQTAARLFQNFLYEYKDMLSAAIIVAGWDPYKGPQIFQVPLGGAVFNSKWAIGGSGSTFIFGFCDANYKENMTFQEARSFVIHAVSHAMSRDGSSGGIIRLVNITKDSTDREFIDHKDLPNK